MKRYIISVLIGLLTAILFLACADNQAEKKNTDNHIAQATTSVQTHKIEKEAQKRGNNSIYQLTNKWTDQNNQEVELSDFKGKIQLSAMIFTSCGYACPKMVDNIKAIQNKLPKELKDQVGFVLFTFDTKVDTPERLHKYAVQKDLDENWTLLHGDDNEVRTVSMLLNTQYKSMSNGMFSHSNILTVLDRDGNIYKQFEGLELNDEDIIAAIQQIK